MIARTYPTPGVGLISSFDGLGRVNRLQSSTQVYADNISYHPSGAMAGMTYGNGQVFSQSLTPRLQPLNTRTSKPGGAVALDYVYGYDARGKVTSVTDLANNANNRVYGYDQLGRLTSASGPWGAGSFTYDALGNIRTKTLGTRNVINSYDNLNRVSQTADSVKGTRSISHDARGNVVQLGAQEFAYDMSDQPTSISGAAVGTYLYDGNRKRVKSVVGGKTIYNVYDASGTLIHVFDQSANKRTDYIGEIARITNGNVTYLHKDHLGSASSGTDSTGAVAWNEQYTLSHCRGLFHLQMIHWIICSAVADQFQSGETILNPAANGNLDGFTGHIKDSATGLQPLPWPSSFKIDSLDQFFGFANQLRSMQARYYDPALGRFLSIDPVGFTPGQPFMFGRYTYVGNDPINSWDPFGENPAAGAVIGCAVTGPACPAGATAGIIVGTAAVIAGAVIITNKPKDGDENEEEGATREDAEDRITEGAEPDSTGNRGKIRIFDNPPTGETADEIMEDIKDTEGSETKETEGNSGPADVVVLPDGSRVVDRNSSSGQRTIEVQDRRGRARVKVRFPKDPPKERRQ